LRTRSSVFCIPVSIFCTLVNFACFARFFKWSFISSRCNFSSSLLIYRMSSLINSSILISSSLVHLVVGFGLLLGTRFPRDCFLVRLPASDPFPTPLSDLGAPVGPLEPDLFLEGLLPEYLRLISSIFSRFSLAIFASSSRERIPDFNRLLPFERLEVLLTLETPLIIDLVSQVELAGGGLPIGGLVTACFGGSFSCGRSGRSLWSTAYPGPESSAGLTF